MPRISVATSFSLRGLMRMERVMALASFSLRARFAFGLLMILLRRRGSGRLLVGSRMGLEGARRRELAELVAHHFFRNVNGNELVAVMHLEGQAHKLRQDG